MTSTLKETAAGTIAGNLEEAIRNRTATFGVIGLGYVGLPLGTAFASVGFNVIGFDINPETVAKLHSGTSHIRDVPFEIIHDRQQRHLFEATTDMSHLAEADIISICVPTPLSKTRDPDISYVSTATEQIARVLRPGQLVILFKSTSGSTFTCHCRSLNTCLQPLPGAPRVARQISTDSIAFYRGFPSRSEIVSHVSTQSPDKLQQNTHW